MFSSWHTLSSDEKTKEKDDYTKSNFNVYNKIESAINKSNLSEKIKKDLIAKLKILFNVHKPPKEDNQTKPAPMQVQQAYNSLENIIGLNLVTFAIIPKSGESEDLREDIIDFGNDILQGCNRSFLLAQDLLNITCWLNDGRLFESMSYEQNIKMDNITVIAGINSEGEEFLYIPKDALAYHFKANGLNYIDSDELGAHHFFDPQIKTTWPEDGIALYVAKVNDGAVDITNIEYTGENSILNYADYIPRESISNPGYINPNSSLWDSGPFLHAAKTTSQVLTMLNIRHGFRVQAFAQESDPLLQGQLNNLTQIGYANISEFRNSDHFRVLSPEQKDRLNKLIDGNDGKVVFTQGLFLNATSALVNNAGIETKDFLTIFTSSFPSSNITISINDGIRNAIDSDSNFSNISEGILSLNKVNLKMRNNFSEGVLFLANQRGPHVIEVESGILTDIHNLLSRYSFPYDANYPSIYDVANDTEILFTEYLTPIATIRRFVEQCDEFGFETALKNNGVQLVLEGLLTFVELKAIYKGAKVARLSMIEKGALRKIDDGIARRLLRQFAHEPAKFNIAYRRAWREVLKKSSKLGKSADEIAIKAADEASKSVRMLDTKFVNFSYNPFKKPFTKSLTFKQAMATYSSSAPHVAIYSLLSWVTATNISQAFSSAYDDELIKEKAKLLGIDEKDARLLMLSDLRGEITHLWGSWIAFGITFKTIHATSSQITTLLNLALKNKVAGKEIIKLLETGIKNILKGQGIKPNAELIKQAAKQYDAFFDILKTNSKFARFAPMVFALWFTLDPIEAVDEKMQKELSKSHNAQKSKAEFSVNNKKNIDKSAAYASTQKDTVYASDGQIITDKKKDNIIQTRVEEIGALTNDGEELVSIIVYDVLHCDPNNFNDYKLGFSVYNLMTNLIPPTDESLSTFDQFLVTGGFDRENLINIHEKYKDKNNLQFWQDIYSIALEFENGSEFAIQKYAKDAESMEFMQNTWKEDNDSLEVIFKYVMWGKINFI